ncbi:peptidylprolyl isomerase [Iocasia frigidifontis]|uniref:peptidylprolyl isomerase n=2 Tax=Iocasia fonsfrigidae TaxID=2682810 RepID=A0A8A7K433_9FIRM|nr:peptidylprolyl isomerase [Iocasia fonsfrigidae]
MIKILIQKFRRRVDLMRFKKFKGIGLFLLVLVLITIPVMAAQEDESQEEKQEVIAAIVNGEELTVNQLDSFINLGKFAQQLYQTDQDLMKIIFTTEVGQDVLNEYRKVKLEGFINAVLLDQEIKNRNIVLTDEEKDEIFNNQIAGLKENEGATDEEILDSIKQMGLNSMEEYKEFLFERLGDQLLLAKLQKEILDTASVTDEEIENYYNDNIDSMEQVEQIKTSHILLENEEMANQVLNQINNGADFAEMAREYSVDNSAKNGGNLGYIKKGDKNWDQDFTEAAFALDENEVSDVVKTQFGYHIIKVFDHVEEKTYQLEEVKDEIEGELLNNKRQEIWNQFILDLHENAEIERKL